MTTKGKVLAPVSRGHGLPLKDGKVYTGAGYYLKSGTRPPCRGGRRFRIAASLYYRPSASRMQGSR